MGLWVWGLIGVVSAGGTAKGDSVSVGVTFGAVVPGWPAVRRWLETIDLPAVRGLLLRGTDAM